MNSNVLRAVWIAVVCCAACSFGHAATAAESKMTPAKSEAADEWSGLALAVKAALEWWQKRATGFPEFQVSPPRPSWELMKDPFSKDKAITYTVLSEDGNDVWFAAHRGDRPTYWEVSMPTRANCTLVYSVAVDAANKEARVWEVRFVYPATL